MLPDVMSDPVVISLAQQPIDPAISTQGREGAPSAPEVAFAVRASLRGVH